MGEFKQKYDELFSNKETYDFRGPLSPLLCGVPWVKDQDFPVFFLAKGRNSFWSIDVNSYRSFSKKKFDDYCAGKHTIAELEREYHALASKIAALYEEETADVSRLKVLSDEDLASKIGFYGELLSALISETIYIETLDESDRSLGGDHFHHCERDDVGRLRTSHDVSPHYPGLAVLAIGEHMLRHSVVFNGDLILPPHFRHNPEILVEVGLGHRALLRLCPFLVTDNAVESDDDERGE